MNLYINLCRFVQWWNINDKQLANGVNPFLFICAYYGHIFLNVFTQIASFVHLMFDVTFKLFFSINFV